MCKKRIPHSKFNHFFFGVNPIWSLLPLLLLMLTSCRADDAHLVKSDSLLDFYPDVASAIAERDVDRLMEYTDHPDSLIANLAWRALAKTETEDPEQFYLIVEGVDSYDAWYALSFHPLNETTVQQITRHHREGVITSDGVCEVYNRHGAVEQLQWLAERDELLEHPACALAAGGIMTRDEVPGELFETLVKRAFESEFPKIRRNLLYGLNRSAMNRPAGGSEEYRLLMEQWLQFGVGMEEYTDRVMVRSLGREAFEKVMETLSDRELRARSGLSVDLAAVLDRFSPESTRQDHLYRLLEHRNPHTAIQAVTSLNQHEILPGRLTKFIENRITGPTRNAELFFISLDLLHRQGVDISRYRVKIDYMSAGAPYLTDRILTIYKHLEEEESYLNRIESLLEQGGVEALHAGRALAELRMESEDERLHGQIREIVFRALEGGNRSVIDGLSALIADEQIVGENDAERLMELYREYIGREMDDAAESLAERLAERFPDRFEREHEMTEKEFRIPDWQRLYDMGVRPNWILETEQGLIVIRLDPLSAPFTVSSIDSLTRSGAYNGVVFHRVVRNFVAQGGDFDRRDGFGGPGHTAFRPNPLLKPLSGGRPEWRVRVLIPREASFSLCTAGHPTSMETIPFSVKSFVDSTSSTSFRWATAC
jgi:hypothetical protein